MTSRAITRRRLLAAGGVTAAAALARIPAMGQEALRSGAKLPIPRLIEAHPDEPVTLTLRQGRHSFGPGLSGPTMGISADYLGPVVRVRTGSDYPFRVENRIGRETTLHWHGLEIPSSVDGGPHNPIAPGSTWTPVLPIRQPAATAWFHPHPHGETARQVYAGLAGMMIIADGGDRDRGLPSRYGVDDLPVILQDKRFDRWGAPLYNPSMMDLMHGFQGDTLLVNGVVGPLARVPSGLVRLRLLNAANARNFDVGFSDGRPFWVIASDGGYLGEPVELHHLLISPGERYEVLVDFSDGRETVLVNGPDTAHVDMPAADTRRQPLMGFAPAVDRADVTRLPARLERLSSPDVRSAASWRTFTLDAMAMGIGRGMGGGGMTMGINGRPYDMERIDFRSRLGSTEIWEIESTDMAHPFHVHGARFRILSLGGEPPPAHQTGWKDVLLVPEHAEVLVRFEHAASDAAPFMYHCHILEHEDQGMMGQFAVV
jgi:blue copper oxidase